MVEENGPNIIQMTIEGEETSSALIRPDFDFVVIPSRYE